jgi:hypothetical protein
MRAPLDRLIALICAVACAATGTVPLEVHARGAANEWRVYNAQGGLIERQLDTNGDGRPDVAEYYRDGALLRRDSDRDFNGVTDLVEDFDATTQQRVRSIVDEDYDGTADVLVLFRNGKAVVSERAPLSSATPAGRARRGGPTGLAAFRNPFVAHSAVDSPLAPNRRDPWIATASSGGLLVARARLSDPTPSLTSSTPAFRAPSTPVFPLRSPRGPPLA